MKKTPVSAACALATLDLLEVAYPEAHCALVHDDAWQLLVATILSAQCTDARVNQVTPELFRRYPDPHSMAAVDQSELEELIRSTGFFRNKARNLIRCAMELVRCHGGEVPQQLTALVSLPGVGRKTANVILNTAFGQPTMAVDTHILRVSNRTGLALGKTPLEVEKKLLKSVPEQYLLDAHHWLILHGRYVCKARTPNCPECIVRDLCRTGRQRGY